MASTEAAPRVWVMHAQRQTLVVDGVEFMEFGDERWVRMCYGGDVVRVRLIEDSAGPYWGWLETGDDSPTMVQPREGMFTMQFAYGPHAEAARGRGQIVRLMVVEAFDP